MHKMTENLIEQAAQAILRGVSLPPTKSNQPDYFRDLQIETLIKGVSHDKRTTHSIGNTGAR